MPAAIALTCTQWDRGLPANRSEFIGLAGKQYLELCDSNLAELSPRTDTTCSSESFKIKRGRLRPPLSRTREWPQNFGNDVGVNQKTGHSKSTGRLAEWDLLKYRSTSASVSKPRTGANSS